MPIEIRRDDRGRLATLPPVDQIEQPEIRKAVEAYDKAKKDAHTASQAATTLEQERPAAVEVDRQLFADRLEKGKGDPGTPATDDADQKIATAVRHAEAAKVVADRALNALIETIGEHEGEWAELAITTREARRQEYAKAVEALANAHAQLSQAAGIADFATGGRFKPGAHVGAVPLPRGTSSTTAIDAVIAGLRSIGQPPEHPTELRIVESGRSATGRSATGDAA